MSFQTALRTQVAEFSCELRHIRERLHERKKFWDPRRREIYGGVSLTPEQKRAIDKLYLENYGEKIPYIWHRHLTAFTGQFDVNYFPELLYIPEFERFENLWEEYTSVFADKNVLPMLAAQAGITMPKTIISCTKGMFRDGEYRCLSEAEALQRLENAGEVFCKPAVDSSSGRGCFVACFADSVDTRSGSSSETLVKKLGGDFVIQERIICHESIRAIYPDSVNTFRVISYRWKDDILFFPSIMRIGRGGNHVDNAHAGGVFIAVDEDGTLHRQAFTEFKEVYDRHPDTGLVYEGYQISLFPKVKAAALRMHEIIPQIGVVNWDFTINQAGEPVLIEANIADGSIWLPEIAHGCGAFGEKTPEVLRWLRLMKRTKPSERTHYAFGKGL